MRQKLGLALLVSVPALGAVVGLVLDLPLALVLLLAAVWALFVLQLASGRSGRALMAYGRLRLAALRHDHPDAGGSRRAIGPPPRESRGLPRLAWSQDGWGHADGYLAGLEQLSEWFDITAFACESRLRGEPPVPLELLPAIGYGPGIKLDGLERRLRDFDVVWAGGSFEGTTWQALDARADGGPAVATIEYENVFGNYGGRDHPIRARSLREVDHFCATATTVAALLMLDGVEESRISLVPMVVDVPRGRIEPRRPEFGLGQGDVVGVYLGRLIPDKGVASLIGALAWARRMPGSERLRLVIAGEGPAEGELRRLVHSYGLEEVVSFAGQVGPETRRHLLASADFLALPSLAVPGWLEQFGRVIPEAFAFGLPVIGSASGAIPEVIGDAGLTAAPGDFGALGGALLEMAGDDARAALTARARERARLYTQEAFAERMRDALMQAIEHRQHA